MADLLVMDPAAANPPELFLGLVPGEGYGWGHVGAQLSSGLSRTLEVELLTDPEERASLPAPVFHMLRGGDLVPAFRARGSANIGYTFFEDELPSSARENAADLDLVLAGSSWCLERLREQGILSSELLIQGVDPRLFYPLEDAPPPRPFVVFSGGKFELRKGQDIVLAAFRKLQTLCPDMILLTAWQNLWPQTIATMAASPHIECPAVEGEAWPEWVSALCQLNGIDSRRVLALPMVSAQQLRELFRRSHLGVFPNRCEGGTNLVLMEYMACGRPVIASGMTGHRDVVHEGNAVLLRDQKPLELLASDGSLRGRWYESSVDELVAALLRAYRDWEGLLPRARQAAREMRTRSWEASAARLATLLSPYLVGSEGSDSNSALGDLGAHRGGS